MKPRSHLLFLIFFAMLAHTTPVRAAGRDRVPSKTDLHAPVLVEADRFGYDSKGAIVKAEGHAQVIQNDYIVLADNITYNQNTNIVRAQGNVTVSEPSGNVYFADHAELKDGVKSGVIANFRARLNQNAAFAAREARKVDDHVTEMDYAVYSGCKTCENGQKKKPFWQIRAQHLRYDETQQRVIYRNAWIDLFGVPVLYTPYFSHATANADRKSGLLMPSYQFSGDLGARVDLPYYWNIKPEMDAVITPIVTTKEGSLLKGDFRHLLTSGAYSLGGSITQENGNHVYGKEWRGHLQGNGNFRLSDFWHWGFDGKYASDDTYLRRYSFGYEDLLTSKVFAEGYRGRTYVNAETIVFQGLRATDDPKTIPVIHPLVDASHETAAGWHGSRFGFTGSAMALSRQIGDDSRRLSTGTYWRLPIVSAGGSVMEIKPQIRADLYSVTDQLVNPANTVPDLYSGLTGRIVPELSFEWRYPLIRRATFSSLILEPVVQTIVGASGVNSRHIPNEDSLALEFSDANLFSENHYPGYDLVEQGTRVNYGIRGQWDYNTSSNILFLFGQNYHTDTGNLFPYSNDLAQKNSDYVGYIAWNKADFLSLAYRFRMDRDTGDLKRNEIDGRLEFDPVTLHMNYIKLHQDPYLGESDEIRGVGSLKLNENWSWKSVARRDLTEGGGMIQAGTGLVFQNECITVDTSINRHYIRDRDIEPSTSLKLEVFLDNLN